MPERPVLDRRNAAIGLGIAGAIYLVHRISGDNSANGALVREAHLNHERTQAYFRGRADAVRPRGIRPFGPLG